jgi:hypothetical protein
MTGTPSASSSDPFSRHTLRLTHRCLSRSATRPAGGATSLHDGMCGSCMGLVLMRIRSFAKNHHRCLPRNSFSNADSPWGGPSSTVLTTQGQLGTDREHFKGGATDLRGKPRAVFIRRTRGEALAWRHNLLCTNAKFHRIMGKLAIKGGADACEALGWMCGRSGCWPGRGRSSSKGAAAQEHRHLGYCGWRNPLGWKAGDVRRIERAISTPGERLQTRHSPPAPSVR